MDASLYSKALYVRGLVTGCILFYEALLVERFGDLMFVFTLQLRYGGGLVTGC